MNIKRYRKCDYFALRVTEDLGIRSDLSALKDAVVEYLEKGITRIAVSFTPHSFLNSEAVAVCVQCVEMVRDKGGTLGIIRPNAQILDILKITGLEDLVQVFDSEEELQG
ncbi:MAG: STAS domain-containing protein [Chitinivibrionales bacterium]|nr:STAS domain-containing protein [Chitinivibrionales bacterium]MBD3396074.1 STAS domain-containing protein [Chitinivibrionales bacterium]